MPIYSEDLWWRIVWLHLRGLHELQRYFRTVVCEWKECAKYVDSCKATGLVAPASQKHGPAKLLSDFEQEFLLESLIANPSTYLSELCEQLEEATGRVVHPSTICRTIQHFGMTRKKSGPLQSRGVGEESWVHCRNIAVWSWHADMVGWNRLG